MNKQVLKLSFAFLLIVAFCLMPWADLMAQCPMCRMSAESNLANGGTQGKGLNNGILYMLATPYLIVGGIAYVWWRNRKKVKEDQEVFPPADNELVD
jgi:hypothetical protein